MKIPFKYTVRNFWTRKLTTIITITGIALVVFVFAAVLMMAYGVQKTMVSSGSPDNVIVARKSANGEVSSIIDGETQNVIRTLPYIAKDSDGTQIISSEVVVIINLHRLDGALSNVTVRGVMPTVSKLRSNVEIIEGRNFNPSLRELVVGEALAKRFQVAHVGNSIDFAGDKWKIVGIFSTGGTGFDSEFWGNTTQLLDAFNRGNSASTLTLKLDDVNNLEKFKRTFEADKRLSQFEAKSERDFFEEQSQFLASFIRILGIFITVIFSFGAIVGAMITMYAAVANRTVEIGTMRSLGFSRRSIMIVFLIESLSISLIGGVIGLLLASVLQFFSVSTLNFNSFSELSFSFALSASIVYSSLIFAVIMGVVGGFLPSVRAARMNIVSALRAG